VKQDQNDLPTLSPTMHNTISKLAKQSCILKKKLVDSTSTLRKQQRLLTIEISRLSKLSLVATESSNTIQAINWAEAKQKSSIGKQTDYLPRKGLLN